MHEALYTVRELTNFISLSQYVWNNDMIIIIFFIM